MEKPPQIFKNQIREGIRVTQKVISKLIVTPELLSYQSDIKSRPFGEILLHIIRSLEYYLRGVATAQWEFLPYKIEDYDTTEKLQTLFDEVSIRLDEYIGKISPDEIHHYFDTVSSYGLNLLIELLHHHSHHIGQLSIYLRLNNLEPVEMQYII